MESALNNILFGKSQKYMKLLLLAEATMQHLQIESSKINPLTFIRDTAFCGLLQNGIDYELDKKTMEIRISIDGTFYSCSIKTAAKILGEEAKEFLPKDFLAGKEEKSLEYTHKTQNDPNAQNDTINAVKVEKIDRIDKKDFLTNKIDYGNSPKREKQLSKNNEMEKKSDIDVARILPFMNKEQKEKKQKSFVYERIEITADKEKTEYLIMPLMIFENEPSVPFVIGKIKEKGIEMLPLNQNGQAEFSLGGIALLVKTSFVNGKFLLNVNALNGDNRMISVIVKDKSYCHAEAVGYGHICFAYKEMLIHVLPLTKENDETGNAQFAYCVTDMNQKIILPFQKYATGQKITINNGSDNIEILCYWKEKTLIAEIV